MPGLTSQKFRNKLRQKPAYRIFGWSPVSSIGAATLGLWLDTLIHPEFREGIFLISMSAIFWSAWGGSLSSALLTGCIIFAGLNHSDAHRSYHWNYLDIQSTLQWILLFCSAALSAGAGEYFRRQVEKRTEDEAFHKFLRDLQFVLDTTPDTKGGISRIGQLIAPQFADWCVIELLNTGDSFQRLLVYHSNPACFETARRLMELPSDLNAKEGVGRALREKKSIRWPRPPLSSKATAFSTEDKLLFLSSNDRKQQDLIRQLGISSYMTAIGAVQNKPYLALTWVRSHSNIPYTDSDLRRIEEIANRLAWAFSYSKVSQVAKETSVALQQVLSVVSTQMSQPLASVNLKISALISKLNSDELRRGSEPEQILLEAVAKHAQTIRQTTTKLCQFIVDLQDFAKIENGTLTVSKTEESLIGILGNFGKLVQTLLQQNSVQLKMELPKAGFTFPPVFCDRERIEQVLSTLVSNALRFTRQGGTLSIRIETQGVLLRVSVQDFNVEVPPQELQRLFNPLGRTRKMQTPLGGFSLAIAKGIIEAHCGKLWAESSPTEGTAFYFTLPVAERRPTGFSARLAPNLNHEKKPLLAGVS